MKWHHDVSVATPVRVNQNANQISFTTEVLQDPFHDGAAGVAFRNATHNYHWHVSADQCVVQLFMQLLQVSRCNLGVKQENNGVAVLYKACQLILST